MFDFISSMVATNSYAGICLLMFIENMFPPIPSEVIMPIAGSLVARGELSFTGVMLSGTFGTVAGTSIWYYAAVKIGRQRLERFVETHQRWLTISPNDLSRAENKFETYQSGAVFFGRLLPVIRTIISVPAGFSNMNTILFLSLTTAGSALWVGFLTLAGMFLGQHYDRVQVWLNPVTNIIIAAIVISYVYRLTGVKRSG